LANSKKGKKPISREEYTTNKVLAVFSLCLLGVLILMILQRLMSYGSSWRTAMILTGVLFGLGIVGIIVGIYLLTQERAGKRSAENRLLCGQNISLVGCVLAISMAIVYKLGTMPIKGMYVALPVMAIYYLIYHSYSSEFFTMALDTGIALALMWLTQRALLSSHFRFLAYAAPIAAVVLAAIQVAIISKMRKNNGKYQLGGKEIKANLGKNAYTMLTATPLLMAVLTAAVLFMPARYLVFLGTGAAFLFITAVYYTVKLM